MADASRSSIFSASLDTDVRLWSILTRLVRETGWSHAPGYGAALALSAIVAGTTGAVLFLLEDVINDIFVDKNRAALFGVAIAIVVIFLVRGLAMFGQAVLLNQIGNAIVLELQVKLFRKVLQKEPSFVSTSSSGELMTVIGSGAGSANSVLSVLAMAVGRDLFTLIALLVVLIWQDASLAITMLIAIPIIALIVSSVTKRLRNISRQQLEVSANLGNRIRGSIQGLRVIKAFAMEREFGDAMAQNADHQRRLANKFAIVSNRVAPFMELVGGLAIAAAIAFGGWRVIDQGETPGELVSFIVAAIMAYDPARRLGQARTALERSLVGVRMMYDFLDAPDEAAETPNRPALAISHGEIRFEDIRFAYDPSVEVLRGVSFAVEAGKTTAIVGRSGGGKTTIANLLLRFWPPRNGRILIDGQDIADVTSVSLRNSIAYVGQDAFLFDGTIRENLRVGQRDADEADLRAAAAAAGAIDFIDALPQGFDTSVGELGTGLSGGQRQRIAIARALLRDSPIVVLDEPTSALDGETERGIQQSLRRLAENRTTIIIAHRLSTIKDADQIIVMQEGRVAERGTHAALLAMGGVYARLYGEATRSSSADTTADLDAR